MRPLTRLPIKIETMFLEIGSGQWGHQLYSFIKSMAEKSDYWKMWRGFTTSRGRIDPRALKVTTKPLEITDAVLIVTSNEVRPHFIQCVSHKIVRDIFRKYRRLVGCMHHLPPY